MAACLDNSRQVTVGGQWRPMALVLTGELDVTITVPLKSRRRAANYAEHCVEREKLPGKLRSIKY